MYPKSKWFSAAALATAIVVGAALVVVQSSDAGATAEPAVLEDSRLFIEYNSTDNDLGFHVFLDGEDWKSLKISDPSGRLIFKVEGKAGYQDFGLTELFFEGAEPSLAEVPLEELLGLFPPGNYDFEGRLAEGGPIVGDATLSHAVPAGPDVSASDDAVGPGNTLIIRWDPVTEVATDPAGGVFPDLPIDVEEYQVIVGSFEVTIPATEPPSPMSMTVPPEYVASLEAGVHDFEVLAIDRSGNQTITSSTFTK